MVFLIIDYGNSYICLNISFNYKSVKIGVDSGLSPSGAKPFSELVLNTKPTRDHFQGILTFDHGNTYILSKYIIQL